MKSNENIYLKDTRKENKLRVQSIETRRFYVWNGTTAYTSNKQTTRRVL